MSVMEDYKSSFLDELKKRGISKIVYTESVQETKFITLAAEKEFSLYGFEDARTVGYVGTGMCAELLEPIVICTCGDNEYRSFMSAMTEAFYRDLPLIVVTLHDSVMLDSCTEMKDISHRTVCLSYKDDPNIFCEKVQLVLDEKKVVHVEFDLRKDTDRMTNLSLTDVSNERQKIKREELFEQLAKYLNRDCKVYVDCDIKVSDNSIADYKTICDGAYGHEGRLAYVLGASFAKKSEKYIGIVTEKNAIHDINTFGNREMNDRVVYIVIKQNQVETLRACAENVNFEVRGMEQLDLVATKSDRPVLYLV